MMDLKKLEIKLTPKGERGAECKGIFYRGYINRFMSRGGWIESRRSLRLLKRRSCPGCEKCSWYKDELEHYHMNEFDVTKGVKHGQLYKLEMIITPGPYEYPNDTDIDFKFVEISEDG